MNDKLIYPRSIEDLEEQISLMYQIYVPEDKDRLIKWEEWFNNNRNKITIDLDDGEYLRIYYEAEKKSLQVWKHLEDYDFLEYNILSNYYDEFVNDKTIVTNTNKE